MKETTAGAMGVGTINAFVYGVEGSGKTRLVTTLGLPPEAIRVITPEPTGPTTLKQLGYGAVKVALLDEASDFDTLCRDVFGAVKKAAADPAIKAIVFDGVTHFSGMMINSITDGEGEKAMGFDGWGKMLAAMRTLASLLGKAHRAGKSVITTAWELPPEYAEQAFGDGQNLISEGRPYIMGKAKFWLPGGCDIVARIRSSTRRQNGATVWKSELILTPEANYLAKTRWNLPSPFPADLGLLLREVEKLAGAPKKTAAPVQVVKPVAPKKIAPVQVAKSAFE